MAKAVMRAVKHKTMASVAGATAHELRKMLTPNADPSKLSRNVDFFIDENGQKIKFGKGMGTDAIEGATVSDMLKAMDKKLEGVWKKPDSVIAVEYLLTTSPDAEVQKDPKMFADWRQANLDWLTATYGAENILSFHVQMDEKTKHISALVLPIDESKGVKKLNAKKWLGGKQRCSEMQTDYAKAMERFGLERGLEGSKKPHTTTKEYGAALTKFNKDPELCSKKELMQIAQAAQLDNSKFESGYARIVNELNDLKVQNKRLIVENGDLLKQKFALRDKSAAAIEAAKLSADKSLSEFHKNQEAQFQGVAKSLAALIRANYTPQEVGKVLGVDLDPKRKNFFEHLTKQGLPFAEAVWRVAGALERNLPKPAIQQQWKALEIKRSGLEEGFGL